MENTVALDTDPKADAEYEAGVDALIAEMKQMRTQMEEDQRDIERLRIETDLILAQMKAT